MVGQREKMEMRDYVVAELEGSNPKVTPITKELVSGIRSSYVKLGSTGLVLLVDQVYPNGSLQNIHEIAQKQNLDMGFVFYKDRETFFRSAAKNKHFKKEQGLSLKNYSNEDLRKMLLFRPEEELVYDLRDRLVQYYQPESQRLPQGIVTFRFEPVVFDYSHILPEERVYHGITEESKKLRIWNGRNFSPGKVKLKHGFIVPQ
jgi:hypothetical protein